MLYKHQFRSKTYKYPQFQLGVDSIFISKVVKMPTHKSLAMWREEVSVFFISCIKVSTVKQTHSHGDHRACFTWRTFPKGFLGQAPPKSVSELPPSFAEYKWEAWVAASRQLSLKSKQNSPTGLNQRRQCFHLLQSKCFGIFKYLPQSTYCSFQRSPAEKRQGRLLPNLNRTTSK